MEINKDTGLPELPNGQYWETAKNEYGGTYRLRLMESADKLKLVVYPHPNRFLARLGFTRTEEPKDRLIDSTVIGQYEAATSESEALAMLIPKNENWSISISGNYGITSYGIQNRLLNDENVLLAATELYEREQARQTRLKNEVRLLGKFPPRSVAK